MYAIRSYYDGSLLWHCPDGISFDVKNDRTGHDPVKFKNVKNGTVTDYTDDRNLYIADPKNANVDFTVIVEPYNKH